MSSKTKKIFSWCLVVACLFMIVLFGPVLVRGRVSAAGTGEYNKTYIKKRILYQKLSSCYDESINSPISFAGVDASTNDEYLFIYGKSGASIFKTGRTTYTPTGFGIEDNSLKCLDDSRGNEEDLMSYLADRDVSEWLSQLSPAGSNISARTEYYTGMGFTASSSTPTATERRCYSIYYSADGSDSGASNRICFDFGSDDSIVGISSEGSSSASASKLYVTLSGKDRSGNPVGPNAPMSSCSDGSFKVEQTILYADGDRLVYDTNNQPDRYNNGRIDQSVCLSGANKNNIGDWFNGNYPFGEEVLSQGNLMFTPEYFRVVASDPIEIRSEDAGTDIYTFNMSLKSQKLREAIAKLQGINIVGATAWADPFARDELYYIHMGYLVGSFSGKAKPSVNLNRCKERDDGEEYLPVVVKENESKTMKWCLVENYNWLKNNVSESKSSEKLSLYSNNSWESPSKIQTTDLIAKIREYGDINISRVPTFDEILNSFSESSESESEDGTTEITCANSGGAASLGWIVCPILEWLGNAAEGVYNKYVEPQLRLDPRLFSGTDGSLRGAWDTIRNIANTLFIILLLFVIFSQLTGVGIDNYGIKKILPKLIIAAILINLSYILCIIAVDLSNIIGNGLQQLFINIAPTEIGLAAFECAEATAEVCSSFDNSSIGVTAVTGIGLLALLVGMTGMIWRNPAVLLSLLVGALGVAIAVFFLFVLLVAREAAVVVLVVMSPLAVACYMIPNTKKLFDKWGDLFKNMLLVYPICGLLVGGGNYVSRLLLSGGFATDGFVSAFTAMIIGIIPIFFIPTVLKASFNAMGKLGAALTGLGNKARNTATNRIRKSEGYQNAQQMSLERRNRKRIGMDKDGILTAKGEKKAAKAQRGWRKALGGDRRFAARVSQAKKVVGEQEAAGALLTGALAASGIAKAKKLHADGVSEATVDSELGSVFSDGQEGAYFGQQFINAASKGDQAAMNAAIQAMKNSNMRPKDIAKLLRFAQNHNLIKGMPSEQRSQWMRNVAKQHNDILSNDYELMHSWLSGGTLNGGVLGNYGDYAASVIDADEFKPEDFIKLSGDSLAGLAASGKLTQGMAQRIMAMNPNISEDKKIMLGAIASGAASVASISSSGGWKAFKDDAKALMTNHGAATGTINANAQMVSDWVRNTPVESNVVQRFANPEDGQRAPVWVTLDGNGNTLTVPHGNAPNSVDTTTMQEVLHDQYDGFSGETHVNAETGKTRTYDHADIYPRLKGETAEEYGKRMKAIKAAEEAYLQGQVGRKTGDK